MQEFTCNLYFDDILQPKEDYSDIKKNFNLTIKREESFNGGENILRELSRTTLDVKGCCYTYLCDKFKSNPCAEVKVYIEITIHGEKLTFKGLFRLSAVEWYHKKKMAKINGIKDNSFSGLIQGFTNVTVDLENVKTINCDPIKIKHIFINTPTTPNTYVIDNIKAFDVLDVFKYIIAYFTDNKITVKSDFLTNTKLAIATGYAMHNKSYSNSDIYPKLSLDTLFNEVNKKYPIKKVIEYELDGTPYLRIEEESYTYEDTKILELSTIPLDFECHIDIDRLYNGIKVGSETTKLINDDLPQETMPESRLVGWKKEYKTGCGGCIGEKKNELDLISSFIIDGNIVHESMNQLQNVEYDNDEEIFLLNYYFSGTINKLVGNNTVKYNIALNNENTLGRWVGITNSCIKTNNENKYGFLIDDKLQTGGLNNNYNKIFGTNGFKCGSRKKGFLSNSIDIYDFENSLHQTTSTVPPVSSCQEVNGTGYHYFECQEANIYKFNSKIKGIIQKLQPFQSQHAFDVTHELHILVYSDNTFTSILYDFYDTVFAPEDVRPSGIGSDIGFAKDMDITTTDINLVVGNIACVYIRSSVPVLYPFDDFTFEYDYISLELVPTGCTDIKDDLNNFKPYVSTFEMPENACDYNKTKANIRGYYLINGIKCWISEIDYGIGRNTKFQMYSKELIC